MKAFMDEHFLLKNETAKRLYHQYAEHMPIIDYHCHLSAKDIWENRPAENITQIWLGDDHYKWRLMRQNGEPEAFVSGQGGDKERFMAFARTLPYAAGNPVFHWTHLELQRYFGIRETLNEVNAEAIWSETLNALSDGKHTPQTFIEQSNVYALCTTEDPADTLEYHEKLAKWADFKTKVLPAMRPDAALAIEKAGWRAYLARLGECAGREVSYAEAREAWLGFFLLPVSLERLACLEELRRDYRLYVLSNTNPFVMDWARSSEFSPAGKPLDAYFDKLFLSYEMKCMKPDRAIFDRMAAEAPLVPAETLFIDDSAANAAAGAALGYRTFCPRSNSDWREEVRRILGAGV